MAKYTIIRNLIREDICLEMSKQMWLEERKRPGIFGDALCPTTSSFYNLYPSILALCHSSVEKAVGEEIIPSYNYSRIYRRGDDLKKHVDRESCEISFTVTLDYPKSPWLFYFDDNGLEKEIILYKGDCLIYEGCTTKHWRNPMTHQDWQTQGFFHYVRKNGQFANHAYDQVLLKRMDHMGVELNNDPIL
jgi:hypothetical protein